MYTTVIRLYVKHDLDSKSTSNKFTDMMNNQLEYAKDHVGHLNPKGD